MSVRSHALHSVCHRLFIPMRKANENVDCRQPAGLDYPAVSAVIQSAPSYCVQDVELTRLLFLPVFRTIE